MCDCPTCRRLAGLENEVASGFERFNRAGKGLEADPYDSQSIQDIHSAIRDTHLALKHLDEFEKEHHTTLSEHGTRVKYLPLAYVPRRNPELD